MEKAPWPAQVRGRQPTKKYYRARSSPTRGALLLIVGEFLEDALGDALERVEHAVAAHRHGREARELLGVELLLPVSYTHLRAHETGRNLVCRLLLEKKK